MMEAVAMMTIIRFRMRSRRRRTMMMMLMIIMIIPPKLLVNVGRGCNTKEQHCEYYRVNACARPRGANYK